jgi:hypothetical protein
MKAFPTTKPLDSWDDPNQGMDLRDYFAAKALQGLIAQKITPQIVDATQLANDAYMIADEMMEAREK